MLEFEKEIVLTLPKWIDLVFQMILSKGVYVDPTTCNSSLNAKEMNQKIHENMATK